MHNTWQVKKVELGLNTYANLVRIVQVMVA